MRKLFTVVPILAIVAIMAAGCGIGPDQSREDAHDTKQVNKDSPEVVAFNNRFPNVENKCDGHGHRLFVTSNQSYRPILIVKTDATCPGGH